MKKIVTTAVLLLLVLMAMHGCADMPDELAITADTLAGVTPPAYGELPVTTITETAQYTGTVSWSPADSPFAYGTAYTATITLTPKSGYTLSGVASDFFSVAGADTVTYTPGSAVVSAVFPATVTPEVINIKAIPGVTPPAATGVPETTITETAQYTGTVNWSPADSSFGYSTTYTATISLTAKSGYTLSGVTANFFTVAGADTVTHDADSGEVTAVFPATADPVLSYNANGGSAGTAPLVTTNYKSGDLVIVRSNTGNLVGALVGGDHTGSGIKQRLIGWNTASGAASVQYAPGDSFTITEDTILYAVYTTGTDVLRKVGPAGGWVFYDHGDSTQTWGRYLEAAPAATEWTGKTWGKEGTQVGGDTELTNIGSGPAATAAIVASMESQSPPITGTAAQLCDALSYNGYDDWFLPSKNELNQICWVLHSRKWNGSAAEDNPAYGTNRVGGFADESYWSSSEIDFTDTWAQLFLNGWLGDSFISYKTTSQRVRAVRAF